MTDFLHGLDDSRPVTCGVNIFFNFLSSIGFGVYSDEKAKKEAERAEKAKQRGEKAAKKKAVGSQFFNNLAGLLGDEFMKRGATLHAATSRPVTPLPTWTLRATTTASTAISTT